MTARNSGLDFEKVVAEIQRQVDPNAVVSHNKKLIDRLGHRRQFDVVIEGRFAGQEILGVIECKDLKKRVGTPEVDAFVTKSNEINANFKVLVSRRGFSTPAIEKARHYGIQTLSLLPNDEVNLGFKVGNCWYVDLYHWEQLALTLLYTEDSKHRVEFKAEEVTIGGKRVVDWFFNFLAERHQTETKLGWVVGVGIEFNTDQVVDIGGGREYRCRGVEMHAKRSLARKEKFVGMNGTGFFDWQKSRVTLPPKTTITSDSVPVDFEEWEERIDREVDQSGFLHITIVAHSAIQRTEGAIDLEVL